MYEGDITYRANLGISLKGIREDVQFTEVAGGESFEVDGVQISTINVPHTRNGKLYKC